MKCPKCGLLSSNELERCKRCGADWVKERAHIETQIETRSQERARREAEALSAKIPPSIETETKPEAETSEALRGLEGLQGLMAEPEEVPAAQPHAEAGPMLEQAEAAVALDREFDRLYETLRAREVGGGSPRWGGFFRRSSAFSIDLMVLSMLSSLLFYLINVGFQVGMSAHGQTMTVDHLFSLIHIFVLAWLGLVAGYFVMLPAMSGMTVGKWLLGLKIVAANRAPISYPQAMLRWLGYALSAPLGLGFLWIMVSREKRAWHDLLARTWVVRE
jgi:uncharacterized RDD family membrane protein YckC